MSKGLNKAMLIGNLGKDPEMRYTAQGKPVASFSIATTSSWKDAGTGEAKEETTWHNIVVWGKLAEICAEYLKKGHKVYIAGRIQNRSYDDKNGVKKYVSEIVADEMLMLGGKANTETSEHESTLPAPAAGDDLPF